MDEPGKLVLSVHYASPDDSIGRLKVEHADPIALLATELLDEIRAGSHHPDVEIDGNQLTIRATNRTVVYRIGKCDPDRRGYLLTRSN